MVREDGSVLTEYGDYYANASDILGYSMVREDGGEPFTEEEARRICDMESTNVSIPYDRCNERTLHVARNKDIRAREAEEEEDRLDSLARKRKRRRIQAKQRAARKKEKEQCND